MNKIFKLVNHSINNIPHSTNTILNTYQLLLNEKIKQHNLMVLADITKRLQLLEEKKKS